MKTIVFLLLFQNLYAFTLNYSNEAHFQTNEVVVDVAGNDCSTAGYNSPQELLDAAYEAATEFWNRIPTCALELIKGSVKSSIDVSADGLGTAISKATPNTILIGCSDNTSIFSAGILGVANINSSNMNQAAVLINNVDTSFANLDPREKLATLAHEMGHALGLGHSSDASALMYASIGGKIQEKLTIDDYDGCTYLYPHDSPGSCSAIAPLISNPNSSNKSSKGGDNQSPYHFFFSLIAGVFLLVVIGLRRDRFYR